MGSEDVLNRMVGALSEFNMLLISSFIQY